MIFDESRVLGTTDLEGTRWYMAVDGFRNADRITVSIKQRGKITSVLIYCGSFDGTPLDSNAIGLECGPGDEIIFRSGELRVSIEPPRRG